MFLLPMFKLYITAFLLNLFIFLNKKAVKMSHYSHLELPTRETFFLICYSTKWNSHLQIEIVEYQHCFHSQGDPHKSHSTKM